MQLANCNFNLFLAVNVPSATQGLGEPGTGSVRAEADSVGAVLRPAACTAPRCAPERLPRLHGAVYYIVSLYLVT